MIKMSKLIMMFTLFLLLLEATCTCIGNQHVVKENMCQDNHRDCCRKEYMISDSCCLKFAIFVIDVVCVRVEPLWTR